MNSWWRRLIGSVILVIGIVVIYTILYRWEQTTLEGTSVSYARALQVVIESLTTAGFGGDAPWESTAMNLFVVAMNLTGVVLIFLALPILVVPLFAKHSNPVHLNQRTKLTT